MSGRVPRHRDRDQVATVERLCAETVGRLREVYEQVAEFREAIDAAAWLAADPDSLDDDERVELARTLAAMVGIENEIEERLVRLAPPALPLPALPSPAPGAPGGSVTDIRRGRDQP